ncbi:MAG: hypothetical protein JW822_08680 [Spirochaetales bacterium]|nr:hypothetical protein [Spirochaetales bacterium]
MRIRKALLIFLLTFLSTSISLADELPDWVKNPPADSEQYVYFSGQGFNAAKNIGEAEKIATDDLINGIMRFVGVRIHSQTSTDVVATADSYESELRKQVTQSGSARVTGFQIVDKWIQTLDIGVTVYILARYDKQELYKEKERMEQLFIETIEAVAIPEREGSEYFRQGRYFEAIIRFLEATLAAAESDLENKDIYVNRNIDDAMQALERINLYKLNDNITAFVGQELNESFTVKVAEGHVINTRGVPGVALEFSYKKLQNLNKKTETSVMKTDKDGVSDFKHPVCQFVGRETVTVMLALGSYFTKLDDIPRKYQAKVDGFKRLALSKKVIFDFTVLSRVKDIPSGIIVADLDSNGQLISGSNHTASGILESLTQNGFNIKQVAMSPALILNKSDGTIIQLIKNNTTGVERAIFGTAQILDERKDGSRYIVKVTGTIKVVDIASGKILFEKTIIKSGLGSSLNAAKNSSFKAVGKELGKAVARGLQ